MKLSESIIDAISKILKDKGQPKKVHESDRLGSDGLGMDSLDMATLVAQLDAQLNQDPFADGIPRFQTVGDFIRLYQEKDPA